MSNPRDTTVSTPPASECPSLTEILDTDTTNSNRERHSSETNAESNEMSSSRHPQLESYFALHPEHAVPTDERNPHPSPELHALPDVSEDEFVHSTQPFPASQLPAENCVVPYPAED